MGFTDINFPNFKGQTDECSLSQVCFVRCDSYVKTKTYMEMLIFRLILSFCLEFGSLSRYARLEAPVHDRLLTTLDLDHVSWIVSPIE